MLRWATAGYSLKVIETMSLAFRAGVVLVRSHSINLKQVLKAIVLILRSST
jgi:hypothetical protein